MFLKAIFHKMLSTRTEVINNRLDAMVSEHATPYARERIQYALSTGRRFRPLLVTLACDGVGGSWKSAVDLACAIEILHKASLLHDDLVDGDDNRRGRPAFWSRFGAHDAVITGDLLVALSFRKADEWIAGQDDVDVAIVREVFSGTFANLSEGEMLDLKYESDGDVQIADVVRMLHLKSGSLIAASLELGAISGGASRDLSVLLNRIGGDLGVVFQMINDLNNITGIDETSKGHYGQDLERNKKTVPTLALIEAGVDATTLMELDGNELRIILEPAYSALSSAKSKAITSCSCLPDGQLKSLLTTLLERADNKWFWLDNDA